MKPAPARTCLDYSWPLLVSRQSALDEPRDDPNASTDAYEVLQHRDVVIRLAPGLHQAPARMIACEAPRNAAEAAQYRAEHQVRAAGGGDTRAAEPSHQDARGQAPARRAVRHPGRLVSGQLRKRERR